MWSVDKLLDNIGVWASLFYFYLLAVPVRIPPLHTIPISVRVWGGNSDTIIQLQFTQR